MTPMLVHAQRRRIGGIVLAGPPLSGAAVAITGWLAANIWPTTTTIILVNWLSQIFLICVGVCAAVAMTGDPLVEMHESTATSFRRVQAIRAALILFSTIIGDIIMFTPLHLLDVWPHDEGWHTLASPIGATMIVLSVAFITTAFTQAITETTIAVIAAWMFLSMLWDPYVQPIIAQRGIPLAVMAALLPRAWQRLGDSELNIMKVAAV